MDDAGAGIDIECLRAHWLHPSCAYADSGRGLFIVDALARSWGDTVHAEGHTARARLAT
ncbi:hypothetical protein ACLGI4_00695 [Streptomyces sp. HMX112]|uniref:hypothetical protein n=1 Tax=Streptomyces sp. HMX112 TaxID=3390850 RepID=UPI003A80055A